VLLKKALTDHGLRVHDSFYDRIQLGDIIEAYSYPENKQIYSNSEFRRFSSYTDEQMKNNAFTKLFWRSDEVQNELLKVVSDMMANAIEPIQFNVENHELVESLHPRKRTFEMEMGWGAPCFDLKTGVKRATVDTLKVKLIFEWDQDL